MFWGIEDSSKNVVFFLFLREGGQEGSKPIQESSKSVVGVYSWGRGAFFYETALSMALVLLVAACNPPLC